MSEHHLKVGHKLGGLPAQLAMVDDTAADLHQQQVIEGLHHRAHIEAARGVCVSQRAQGCCRVRQGCQHAGDAASQLWRSTTASSLQRAAHLKDVDAGLVDCAHHQPAGVDSAQPARFTSDPCFDLGICCDCRDYTSRQNRTRQAQHGQDEASSAWTGRGKLNMDRGWRRSRVPYSAHHDGCCTCIQPCAARMSAAAHLLLGALRCCDSIAHCWLRRDRPALTQMPALARDMILGAGALQG